MKKSTRLITGAILFLVLFIFFVIVFQSNSLSLNPESLHEKLVGTTRDMKWLSLMNHILFIITLLAGFFWKKSREVVFTLFMIYLCIGAFASAFKYHIVSNYLYFPIVVCLILYAVINKKIKFDFSKLALADKIMGTISLIGSFWYLALVESPIFLNALLYSPVGVVNCPTVLALCGFLILNTEKKNRSHSLELVIICGAIFFGGLGLLTMNVYFDIVLVAMALYLAWRMWNDNYRESGDSI
ncbi:MAG: hypothetical protein MUD12_16955 [Spirochaetes bacterium]|nr:hypothetical protein [Spirochaetota bacterium]